MNCIARGTSRASLSTYYTILTSFVLTSYLPLPYEAAWADGAKLRWRKAAEAIALLPGGGAGGFRAAAAEALRLKQQTGINPAMPPAALHLMTKKELIRLVLGLGLGLGLGLESGLGLGLGSGLGLGQWLGSGPGLVLLPLLA